MARKALTRIRHHPARLRHVKHAYFAGVSVPGLKTIDMGSGNWLFGFTEPGAMRAHGLVASWWDGSKYMYDGTMIFPESTAEDFAIAAEILLQLAGFTAVSSGADVTVSGAGADARISFEGVEREFVGLPT